MSIDDPRLPDRFWAKVIPEPNTGCWLWSGWVDHHGYGQFTIGSKKDRSQRHTGAHRHAYEVLVGAVPDELELDHVRARGCGGPPCCNPDHLEPVTHRENCLRGQSFSALNAAKTHCPAGHEYTPSNTRWERDGSRKCRHCLRARDAERRPWREPLQRARREARLQQAARDRL